MTPEHDPVSHADLVRQRQRARATVLAVLLGAFVVLVFAVSIAKIKAGQNAAGNGATHFEHKAPH